MAAAPPVTISELGVGVGRGSWVMGWELESFLPAHLDGSLEVSQGPLEGGAAWELISMLCADGKCGRGHTGRWEWG